jgi:hypothetical protein
MLLRTAEAYSMMVLPLGDGEMPSQNMNNGNAAADLLHAKILGCSYGLQRSNCLILSALKKALRPTELQIRPP